MKTGIRRLDDYVAVRNRSNFPAHRLAANVLLARRPDFVIIGTGRSGTTFISKHLAKAGIKISHEQYFTVKGPYLRNPNRDWRTRGDASWLAVPFLPDARIPAIHQVRHPYNVIDSLYRIGFFATEHYDEHRPFADFARRHFTFSDDPLLTCLRWYVEWNERCEAITPHRFRIEHLEDHMDDIARWLGRDFPVEKGATSDRTNTRPPVVDMSGLDLAADLKRYAEFDRLRDMCHRYGYALD